MRLLFHVENTDRCGSNWLETKMYNFDPKIWIFWAKSQFLMEIAIFVKRAYHQYARGYNFPIQTTPKKYSVSELWVIFRGSSLFLAVLGLCHFTIISTLNFGPFSTICQISVGFPIFFGFILDVKYY